MHDPLTVAFEIKKPWFNHKPWPKKFRYGHEKRFNWEHRMSEKDKSGRDKMWPEGYREKFITIWHKDPESDGSDDSCGWSYPKLTKHQIEKLHNVSWGESRNPHFLECMDKEWHGNHGDAVSLYEGMVLLVCRVLRIRVSMDFVRRYAIEAIHTPDCCSRTNVFCFLPGYHTNNKNDSQEDRQEHFRGILCGVARGVMYSLRPWYKHPRWHFWHWRFQIHAWQTCYRWAFEKCYKCNKGFRWGESVIGDWSGKRIWHESCDESGKPMTDALYNNVKS